MPTKLLSSIEISASPEVVRGKFLQFHKIPQYHSGFIVALTPLPIGKTGAELRPRDQMRNELGGIKVTPTVIENSPTLLQWRGPWPSKYLNLLCGHHFFRFQPSTGTPGHTLFLHEETFTGPLAFVMGFEGSRRKTMVKFVKFNGDLKAWVEGGLSSEGGKRSSRASGDGEKLRLRGGEIGMGKKQTSVSAGVTERDGTEETVRREES
ncbi:hypothetical protein BJ875DRAFT_489210 [Amylocarpus encephaloides]|uniref:Uncharacterized protein n=1 Tax=Amylocarpus encephaloides TaxID=45428 RepID=A0A9P7Y9H7_9HELO|nr:hypothetical protein BJ875DRAFT_489210 [Amylocarpus encephaloides]